MIFLNVSTGFWENLLSRLIEWDKWLFLKINTQWTNSFFDSVFPWWRAASTWIPLYVLLLVFVIWKLKGKALFWWLILVALTPCLTDLVSSQFLKEWVGRIRPCREPSLFGQMRQLIAYCPQSGSFTSSHATTHFGIAFFVFFTLKSYLKKWGYLFFFWAASISYGQVYVGVHYPLDIIGGTILGSSIGFGTASLYKYIMKRYVPQHTIGTT